MLAADRVEFRRLVDCSQGLSADQLGNQIPETEYLAAAARELGAIAASAFGAGFGGSVWALIGDDALPKFIRRWRESYAGRYPSTSQRAQFFSFKPGPAAFQLAS